MHTVFIRHVYAFFFFFQAEDGIRDGRVTGVQTCALPISMMNHRNRTMQRSAEPIVTCDAKPTGRHHRADPGRPPPHRPPLPCRSEERRVGKECRSRGAPDEYKKKKKKEHEIGADMYVKLQ